MALLSILCLVVVLCVLTLWKRITRKEKIPAGLKKLPGPKGLLHCQHHGSWNQC
jgi:hypothetical protein